MESTSVAGHTAGEVARPASRPRPVRRSPYWKYSLWVTIGMMAVIAVRIHELVPALAPFRPVLVFGFGGMVLLASRTGSAAFRSAWKYTPTRIVLFYFLWVGFTAPFGLWLSNSLEILRALISPVLLFFAVMLNAPTRSNLERLVWAVVAATSAYILLASAASAASGSGWRMGSAGAYDPNDLAALTASVFPLAVGLFLRSKGPGRTIAAIAGGILLLGVVQTGSRGGILALLAGALVVTLGLRGAKFFFVLSVLVVGGLVAWNQASDEFRARMMTFTNLSEDYNVTEETGRIEVWKRALGYIMEKPLLGSGAGNFAVAEGEWLASQGRRGRWSTTHNAFLQAAAETGLVGGALFAGLLLLLGKRAWHLWRVRTSRRRETAFARPEILASLVACATGAMFLSMAYSWILFAVASWVALADRVNSTEVAAARETNGQGRPHLLGPRRAGNPRN